LALEFVSVYFLSDYKLAGNDILFIS
jgi:hypothetical protein